MIGQLRAGKKKIDCRAAASAPVAATAFPAALPRNALAPTARRSTARNEPAARPNLVRIPSEAHPKHIENWCESHHLFIISGRRFSPKPLIRRDSGPENFLQLVIFHHFCRQALESAANTAAPRLIGGSPLPPAEIFFKSAFVGFCRHPSAFLPAAGDGARARCRRRRAAGLLLPIHDVQERSVAAGAPTDRPPINGRGVWNLYRTIWDCCQGKSDKILTRRPQSAGFGLFPVPIRRRPPASREHHPGDQCGDDARHEPPSQAVGQGQAEPAEGADRRQRHQDATGDLCAQ